MSEIVVVSRITTVWWTGIFVVMMTGVVSEMGTVVATVTGCSDAAVMEASVGRRCDGWDEWLFVPAMG